MDTPPSNEPPAVPPTPPPFDAPTRQWAMILHLSALCMFVIPFGNLIGPFIIWQIKKNELPAIDAVGRSAMNFQLSYTIYAVAAVIIGSALSCLIPFLPMLLPFAVVAAMIAFIVIAGVRANNGESYEIPGVIKFLK
jgi:uncharacterized Tic20 family protein